MTIKITDPKQIERQLHSLAQDACTVTAQMHMENFWMLEITGTLRCVALTKTSHVYDINFPGRYPDHVIDFSFLSKHVLELHLPEEEEDRAGPEDAKILLAAYYPGRTVRWTQTNAPRRCPRCHQDHTPCIFCGQPTLCDLEELGEQWLWCEECEAKEPKL